MPVPDPRAEDRALARALERATRANPTSTREIRANQAEIALLEGQIKANRVLSHEGWRSAEPVPALRALTAALGALCALLGVLFLVAGVLGTLAYALIVLARPFVA